MTTLNARTPHQNYLRAQERKRSWTSLGLSVAFYALALLVLWIVGLGREIEYSDYAGPVLVRLGAPEGVEVPSPSVPIAPEPVPQTAPPPPPEPAAKTPTIPTPPPEVAPAKTPRTAPVESPPPAPTPTVPSTESAPSGPVRGEEYGNSHETSFEASAGRVGRSLYIPIWTFMPLPKTVDNRVYDKIPKDDLRSAVERQKIFQNYYVYSSGSWNLKTEVPVDQRQRVWLILEGGGYNIARADYKAGRALKPIQIRFRVGPTKGNRPPDLESAEIVQTSGYSEIDDAVLYGFRQASFSNDSDKVVTGRFTYRF